MKGERAYFGPWVEGIQPIVPGKAQQQGCEAAGCPVSTIKNQRIERKWGQSIKLQGPHKVTHFCQQGFIHYPKGLESFKTSCKHDVVTHDPMGGVSHLKSDSSPLLPWACLLSLFMGASLIYNPSSQAFLTEL